MGCYRIYVGQRHADVHRVSIGVETDDRSVILEPEFDGPVAEKTTPEPSKFLAYIGDVRSVVKLNHHEHCKHTDLVATITDLLGQGRTR